MTNLTEYNWYYCKMKNGDIQMLERGADYFLSGDVPLLNNEVESVLAEVPSYEEWQKHRKTLLKTQEKNCDLEIINKQLKELLKECRYILETEKNFPSCRFEKDTFVKLLAKINQVLGEE